MKNLDMTTAQLNNYFLKKGFEVIGTGGGCEAWRIAFGNHGHEILVTDDAQLPESPDQMVIGLYEEDIDECIDFFEGNLNDCMHWFEIGASYALAKVAVKVRHYFTLPTGVELLVMAEISIDAMDGHAYVSDNAWSVHAFDPDMITDEDKANIHQATMDVYEEQKS